MERSSGSIVKRVARAHVAPFAEGWVALDERSWRLTGLNQEAKAALDALVTPSTVEEIATAQGIEQEVASALIESLREAGLVETEPSSR